MKFGPAQVVIVFLAMGLTSKAQEVKTCQSGDDFIQASEYLKNEVDLKLQEPEQVAKALLIASGCTGAFDRFKNTFELLKNSGVSLGKSFEYGIEISKLTSVQAGNFIEIFKACFLENRLDLDFVTSLKTARALSLETLSPNPKRLRRNFLNLMEYCRDEKVFNLSVPRCLKLTENLLLRQDLYSDSQDLYASFRDLTEFIEKDVPSMASVPARIETAEAVMAQGPSGVRAFKQSWAYLSKSKSEALPAKERLRLALAVSEKALVKP